MLIFIQIMIIKDISLMNDEFLSKKFANKHLGDARTLRIGNIISFLAPVSFISDDDKNHHVVSAESINFCIEIPDISNYAGVCMQKLFLTNATNFLASKYIDSDVEIINNDVVVKQEHDNGGIHQRDGIVSLNRIRSVNGAVLIYLGYYNTAGPDSRPRSFSLDFDTDKCNKLMDDVNAIFYNLANNVFLNCAKI